MDKLQAKEKIQSTFESPFDKQKFTEFARNLLNNMEDAPLKYTGQYIPEAFRNFISSMERIGKYSDGENNIDILITRLKRETSLERARSSQRNFVSWYLNASRPGSGQKDAALVAYVAPDESDWRFSLVKMDYKFEQTKTGKVKVKEEFTPARRWSFLVGANEKSHTAQSRLVKVLIDDDNAPTLVELEHAFDIETVTKEFFLKYRELFLRTKEELDRLLEKDEKVKNNFEAKNVDTVNFAKKLLGQIVFLYFLQKKGWFGAGRDNDWGSGSKNFLRELYEKKHGSYNNFYNDILEPLFYEALRIDRSHDDDYYSRFNCKIPFLNGGLFDPIGNHDWVHTDICLTDSLFSNNNKTKEGDMGDGILDIFDRYNFTVKEDEPLEKEVAIDPELLGKAYEKFNAIRPDNYEEFKAVLKSGKKGEESKFNKKFGVYYTPREIVHYMCRQSLINYLATELEQTSKAEQEISKQDIETLIHAGEHVSQNDKTALEKEQNIIKGIQKNSKYKTILPDSIIKNAKLIDQKLAGITVCDPAVGSGAFPVGMMNEIVKLRNVLSDYINDDENTPYEFKRRCIEHSLYGVDIDPGAIEIAKLRLWLSLIVDETDIKNIKPLPNLDYKIVCGNSLLSVEKNLFNQYLFEKLEKLKSEFLKETSPGKKQDYKTEIDALIEEITNGHTEFDFEVYFSEVFHKKKGFDVVIANPPYGADLNKNEKQKLEKKYKKYNTKVKNTAIYFSYMAEELIKQKGIHTYIVPKSLCYSLGWNKCAEFVNNGLLKLIDTGKAFEEVKLEQVIFLRVNKTKNHSHYINGIYNGKIIKELAKVSKNIFEKYRVLLAGQTIEEIKLINKILKTFYSKWDNYVKIERGLNWQSKATKNKELTPIYRGAQLYKYYLDKPTDFIDISMFNKKDFDYQLKPKILNQLAIAHVLNPYPHFYLQAYLDLEKRLVFETISCTFLKNNDINIKFILGINNSKLFAWLLYKFVYSNAIRSTRYDEYFIGKIPCPNFYSINQTPIINLVDQILAITKNEDYLENNQKQAAVKALEREIDVLVFKLYELSYDEVLVVCPDFWMGREEYEEFRIIKESLGR